MAGDTAIAVTASAAARDPRAGDAAPEPRGALPRPRMTTQQIEKLARRRPVLEAIDGPLHGGDAFTGQHLAGQGAIFGAYFRVGKRVMEVAAMAAHLVRG